LNGSFDFAFIDAEKTEYRQYLKSAEEKLRNGGVVFADNAGIFADQMKDYLDYVRALVSIKADMCKLAMMG
jgi:predicted O-methyltransferase YrrM